MRTGKASQEPGLTTWHTSLVVRPWQAAPAPRGTRVIPAQAI